MNRIAILMSLACVVASAAAADKSQVYKWKDATGVVHFSDAPPPSDTKNVQSVRLVAGTTQNISTDLAASAATAAPAPAAGANPAATPTATGDDAALCKQSRANLELLQSATPVGIAGADGKATALDDAARNGQIANAKAAIAHYCK